jgi:O-methyltransferase involved in polyketide biosynthesis
MTSSAPRAESVSPTAHYTGYVWARNDLSHPALVTHEGRLLFNALRPPFIVSRALGLPTLEGFLLARHRLIDHVLDEAIGSGKVTQVIEIACGLSARGWRFATRYGERLTYVEADLPDMAARKRRALEQAGSLGPHHRVVEIDALQDDGPLSLATLAARLEPGGGTAVITEGLLSYLDADALSGLWRRIARTLERFAYGVYLSDIRLAAHNEGPWADAFMWVLSQFVRGRVQLHFRDAADVLGALSDAGFAHSTLHSPTELPTASALRPPDARSVQVLEALSRISSA